MSMNFDQFQFDPATSVASSAATANTASGTAVVHPTASSSSAALTEVKKANKPTFTSTNYCYRDDPANYDVHGDLIVKSVSCDTIRKKINMFLLPPKK